MRPACFSNSAFALLAAWLLSAAPAGAECGCLWQGSFVEVQGETDLVMAGSVTSVKGNAVDVSVESLLRGDPYRDTVRVWMQTGDYCRPPAEDFPPGSRWVLALERIEEMVDGGFDPGTPSVSYGRVGDYYLSSCGGYWLSYSGEAVTGNLVNAPRWAREPDMTPVLFELLQAFVDGDVDSEAILEASREDPALDELLLDTRAFLRGDTPD